MKKEEGFICPECGLYCVGKVIDTRQTVYGRRRRRVCELCGERFTTIEKSVSFKKILEEFKNGNK